MKDTPGIKRTRTLIVSICMKEPEKIRFLILTLLLFSAVTTVLGASASATSYTQNGGTVNLTGQAYTANSTDESGVLVTNSGLFTLTDSTVTTSGNSSSSDSSSFYGLNAGVLANEGGSITLSHCTITTSGAGANGVFAYGTASITMTDDTVTCTGQYAHAVMASGGGTLTVENVDMNTDGANSAAIATDRGGGTITVQGGTIATSGNDAPGIYSTGNIRVTGSDISASSSEGAVIEGLNTVTLSDTALSGNQSTYGGVLIVQSMSGDAAVGTATFSMDGGSLTANAGPIFFVTNTKTVITLTGVALSAPSGILLTAAGTSRWGTSGSNGGTVTFVADGQTLTGTIQIDSLSSFTATLKNGSTLTGSIDAANTASSVSLTLDASSTWNVTAESYLSSLSDSSGISGSTITNIIGNGNNVYYDATLNSNGSLGGLTYSLVNGGSLIPNGESTSTTGCFAGTTQPGAGKFGGDILLLLLSGMMLAVFSAGRIQKRID